MRLLYRLGALVERPIGMHYTDIGHSEFGEYAPRYVQKVEVNKLWVIWKNWQLQDAEEPANSDPPGGGPPTHSDIFGFYEYQDVWIAKGRYEKSEKDPNGIVSLQFAYEIDQLREQYPRRYEYAKNRVVEILDGHYGVSVKIVPFH
jgi:hypothetical protein